MSIAIPRVSPGGVFCVTKSGLIPMSPTRNVPVGASSAFAAEGISGPPTVAQAARTSSTRSESTRFMTPPLLFAPSLRLEELVELLVRFVGHLFRRIVAARHHLAAHVASALRPRLDPLLPAAHLALLPPPPQHRH